MKIHPFILGVYLLSMLSVAYAPIVTLTHDGLDGYDPNRHFITTELTGNRTWGDGSTDTIVWTWDRATGTDPCMIFGNDVVTFNGGLIADTGRLDNGIWCDGATGDTPTSGAGTRLMWIPAKKAFRAGKADATGWDAANIGDYSIAFGDEGRATGEFSVHFGQSGVASGDKSVCWGVDGEASGSSSFHLGDGGVASGADSVHFGSGGLASGDFSMHYGQSGVSSGDFSTHFGQSGTASGLYSFHTGLNNLADCYGLLTLGRYSAASGAADTTSWAAGEPILIIGNGTGTGARSNILTVYKNGNIGTDGAITSTTYNFAADGEADDDYEITLSPAPAAYTTGMMITFSANTANTGACDVNVNGLGDKTLLMLNDQAPADSYIEAGSMVIAVYDGTNFQMIQPDANP